MAVRGVNRPPPALPVPVSKPLRAPSSPACRGTLTSLQIASLAVRAPAGAWAGIPENRSVFCLFVITPTLIRQNGSSRAARERSAQNTCSDPALQTGESPPGRDRIPTPGLPDQSRPARTACGEAGCRQTALACLPAGMIPGYAATASAACGHLRVSYPAAGLRACHAAHVGRRFIRQQYPGPGMPCHSPPESSRALRSGSCPVPARSSAAETLRDISPRGSFLQHSPQAMLPVTRLPDRYAECCWPMTCERIFPQARHHDTPRPGSLCVTRSGDWSPAIVRSSADLPTPLQPLRATQENSSHGSRLPARGNDDIDPPASGSRRSATTIAGTWRPQNLHPFRPAAATMACLRGASHPVGDPRRLSPVSRAAPRPGGWQSAR